MSVRTVAVPFSDVTGEKLANPLRVQIVCDGVSVTVDVDRDRRDEELAALTLLDALNKGQRTKLPKFNARVRRPVVPVDPSAVTQAQLYQLAREWAKDKGYAIGARGPVPKDVVNAYLEANPVIHVIDTTVPCEDEPLDSAAVV